MPFLQVSDHLDLPPVATYAALNLWNFSTTGRDFTDVDKLEALHTFSGTEDESWFFVLSVAIEARGAHIIPTMLQAIDAIKHKDYETVTRALNDMATCIRQLTPLLDRMFEKCDPMLFYHQLRPFLAGSKNMAAAGLPNGVFYDEGNGIGQWRQLRGGSNGQSSLLQFFDLVLGIDHAPTSHHQMPKGNSGAPAKAAPGELSLLTNHLHRSACTCPSRTGNSSRECLEWTKSKTSCIQHRQLHLQLSDGSRKRTTTRLERSGTCDKPTYKW